MILINTHTHTRRERGTCEIQDTRLFTRKNEEKKWNTINTACTWRETKVITHTRCARARFKVCSMINCVYVYVCVLIVCVCVRADYVC